MGLFGKKEKADFSSERSVAEYLRGTASGKDSSAFRDVAAALDELQMRQEETKTVSAESVQKVVLANAKLIQACETYLEGRQGAVTSRGKERLEAVAKLCEQRKEKNLDQLRDMREVKKHEGKTWEEVNVSIPVRKLESGAEVVGSNVNRRVKTEHNGKTGFFTERRDLLLWKEQMGQLIGNETDPRRRDIYERNREWLEKKLAPVTQDTNPLPKLDKAPTVSMRIHLADTWQSMDMSDPQFGLLKDLVGKIPKETANALAGYQNEAKRLDEDGSLSPGEREARKIQAFEAQVRQHIPENYQQSLTDPQGARQYLMRLGTFETETKKSLLEVGSIRADLIEERARLDENTLSGSVRAVAINNFVRDEKALKDCADTIRVLASADTADSLAGLGRGKESELTDRNVATSRIAELLGVGSIVAHSEKMVVKEGDKTREGCFMEFAEGTDFNSKKETTMRTVAEKVEFSRNPGFYKDQSTIEMLDFLCGQMDRNPGNMFYKLSEPGPDGKCNVIGLQGIDNDLAFGTIGALLGEDGEIVKANNLHMEHMLEHQFFIDKKMAEAIQGLDREKLEFALGDLLPQKNIDIMWERTKYAKQHIKEHMAVVEEGGWELDKIKLEDYTFSREEATPEKKAAAFKDIKSMGITMALVGDRYIDTEKLKALKASNPEEFNYVCGLWDRERCEDKSQKVILTSQNKMMRAMEDTRKDLAAIKAKDDRFMEDAALAMEAMFQEKKTEKWVKKEVSFKEFEAGSRQARPTRRPRPQGPAIGAHEKKGPVQEQVKGR